MTGSWPTGLDVVWADIRGHARFPMDEASELKQVDEGTGFLDVSGCRALCERDKSCLGFAAVGGEAHDHGLVPICQTFTSDDSDHPSDLTKWAPDIPGLHGFDYVVSRKLPRDAPSGELVLLNEQSRVNIPDSVLPSNVKFRRIWDDKPLTFKADVDGGIRNCYLFRSKNPDGSWRDDKLTRLVCNSTVNPIDEPPVEFFWDFNQCKFVERSTDLGKPNSECPGITQPTPEPHQKPVYKYSTDGDWTVPEGWSRCTKIDSQFKFGMTPNTDLGECRTQCRPTQLLDDDEAGKLPLYVSANDVTCDTRTLQGQIVRTRLRFDDATRRFQQV